MSIGMYLKEIGRGMPGARTLSRVQAADLMGQVLDGTCSELETGALCMAMRIKGESVEELTGFLDALRARIRLLPRSDRPVVVLPSYSGTQHQPMLTPLLALMLARKGLPVLMHGGMAKKGRVSAQQVLAAAGIRCHSEPGDSSPLRNGQVRLLTAGQMLPGLQRLLDVRRAIGMRTPAHSMVKLLSPIEGPSLIVTGYAAASYADTLSAACLRSGIPALLLRGAEGEPVADPRRTPRMDFHADGRRECLQTAHTGALASLPPLPRGADVQATARYMLDVMHGKIPAPQPIAQQVDHIVRACKAIAAAEDLSALNGSPD